MVLLFCLSACGDYSIRLPGGYSLVRVYSGAVLIAGDHTRGVVIDPNVEGYAVLGDLVVGRVNTPGNLTDEDMSASVPGYFILNTKAHTVRKGLVRQTWLDSLKELGITAEPRLSNPSRFDKNYSAINWGNARNAHG